MFNLVQHRNPSKNVLLPIKLLATVIIVGFTGLTMTK